MVCETRVCSTCGEEFLFDSALDGQFSGFTDSELKNMDIPCYDCEPTIKPRSRWESDVTASGGFAMRKVEG